MRDYVDQINSIRLCAESDDPVDECCLEDCNQHHGNRDNMCRQKIMMDAADAIEELLAAAPKWISVEDEPPKENGRYLVRYKRDINLGDEETVHEDELRLMRFFVGDGWCYPIICNDYVRLVDEEVTHWMPLPEPPKEAE